MNDMSELGVRTIVAIGLLSLLALTVIFGGWVQVGVLTGDVGDAGASLLGVEVVMTYDECTRIAAVKVL